MHPIRGYLLVRVEPKREEKMRKLRVKGAQFVLIDGLLYKKSFSISYLRCLTLSEAKYAIREVHKGVCSNHLGA